jgi:hypothetical protein
MTALTPIHREMINLTSCQRKKVGAGLHHQDAVAPRQRHIANTAKKISQSLDPNRC